MLAEAAATLDIDCFLVDPGADAPLAHGERVVTAFDDPLAISVLSSCDAVTVELEGVPIGVLERLAGVTAVRPPPRRSRRQPGSPRREGSLHRCLHPNRPVHGLEAGTAPR